MQRVWQLALFSRVNKHILDLCSKFRRSTDCCIFVLKSLIWPDDVCPTRAHPSLSSVFVVFYRWKYTLLCRVYLIIYDTRNSIHCDLTELSDMVHCYLLVCTNYFKTKYKCLTFQIVID